MCRVTAFLHAGWLFVCLCADDNGIHAYHEGTYSRTAFMSIHNHANNIDTIGMGETKAVLNGGPIYFTLDLELNVSHIPHVVVVFVLFCQLCSQSSSRRATTIVSFWLLFVGLLLFVFAAESIFRHRSFLFVVIQTP